MEPTSPRWKEVTRSEFPWERAALDYLREQLPDHEPYRAWSNFEFIADDGSVNEVDLLVLTPKGFFLVEIKSRPGAVTGDVGTWTWTHEGRVYTVDNPYLLANKKAKKLISLLKRQESVRRAHTRLPFLQAKIFLSAEDIDIRLDPHLRQNVHHRDRPSESGSSDRDGILYALTKWERDDPPRFRVDRPIAKVLSRAMDEAGIRRSQKARVVGDYRLGPLLYYGPGYQDWEASHVALDNVVRRVRIYGVGPDTDTGAKSRETVLRAAKREFEILQGVTHPGILKAVDYKEHELGPALVFEHDPEAVRLDHFLQTQAKHLDSQQRLNLVRQIAEAVQFAHEKRLVHRALSPQSILVLNASTDPQIQIFNWQTGARGSGSQSGASVSGTVHVDQLIENPASAYMAPEAFVDRGSTDEEMDVFSLGAIAYHVFSGEPPAASFYELTERIRDSQGLQISSVLDGAGAELQTLIKASTYPEVTGRIPSVSEFLKGVDEVEAELARPDTDEGYVPDPTRATKGDCLEHGFVVQQRLGKGASAVGLLVEREGVSHVLKVALTSEANERLENEAEVLKKLRHQYIVELHDELDFDGRVGLLMAQASEGTLAERLRDEGRLQLELLERFGEDLLQAVEWLDQQGIPHRDIKPENIGVTEVGKNRILHLILFDFSLARTPPENISAGTVPYLDPFLSLRKPPRWDTHAERFAAAMTLYEMTTGTLPVWGDGQSNPAVLECEATIDAALFDPALRDGMTEFFKKALRRNHEDRFDNAQDMLQAWRQIFQEAEKKLPKAEPAGEVEEALPIEQVKLSTPLALMGLSTRALNVLERLNALTVRDFLRLSIVSLFSMRGVGSKTRRELSDLYRKLQSSFPDVERAPLRVTATDTATPEEESRTLSVDVLAEKLISKKASTGDARVLRQILGLEDADPHLVRLWPSQSDVGRKLDLAPASVGAVLRAARKRWGKTPALTHLAEDICRILDAQGGVMTAGELADAIVSARGSDQDEPRRTHLAVACLRAVAEAERERAESRFIFRRPHSGTGVLLARDEIDRTGEIVLDGQKLADYAQALGAKADELVSDDVLPSPARVEEALRSVPVPAAVTPLSPNRRLNLAAAASTSAAVSSRLELYPRGMPAAASLRLAQGALAGAKELTLEQIEARVRGRYPQAEPLPGRPELDAVLAEVGSELTWDPEAASGQGAYVAPRREFTTVSSRTSLGRFAPPAPAFRELSPEETDARLFQERLEHASQEGAFLALTVPIPGARRAQARLAERYDVDVRSFEALLIQHMKAVAAEKNADWNVVLRADREGRGTSDWANLLRVVRLALERVRAELAESKRTVLLTNAGPLARYDQMGFLDEIRDSAGRPGGPPGLWLLIPGDHQQDKPMLDGVPVPVFTRAQWARIPEVWLARAG